MDFFTELKRRHVFRVVVAYTAVGWVLIEVGATIVPALHLPDGLTTAIVVLVLMGFPVAVVLAWALEMTPDGVRRTEPAKSPAAREPEQRRRVGRTLDFVIIGVLALAIAVLLWRQFVPGHGPAPSTAAIPRGATAAGPGHATSAPVDTVAAKSIAVLPFENLSADKDNEYFVSGMQDMILTRLADIGGLKVISRTSTEKYRSRPDNLKQVAAELGVATLLEGSVQKAGNQVLINVQLIDADTDAHLWAEAYPRTLENIFGVEGEVAQKIADALKARLTPAEASRVADQPTHDPAAYDLFLRAEYLTHRGQVNYDNASMKSAINLYRKAVTADPGFALAWARLSFAQSSLAWYGGSGVQTPQVEADARASAQRAVALQPEAADAYLAVGYSDYWGQSDYPAALKAFSAALDTRPNEAGAMAAIGYVLRRQARFDESIAALRKALDRDPRNTIYAFELAVTETATGHYAEAERLYQRALALDPDNINAKVNSSFNLLMGTGDIARALARAQGDATQLRFQRILLLTYQRHYRAAIDLLQGIADTPENFSFIGGSKALELGNLYWLAGDKIRARQAYERALPLERADLTAQANNPIKLSYVWGNIANAELGLGRTDEALAAIDKSLALQAASGDHVYGPQGVQANAVLYARAGRTDRAVTLLKRLFAMPGSEFAYSPLLLRIDPAWDPIRDTPQFQALLNSHADQPVSWIAEGAGGD